MRMAAACQPFSWGDPPPLIYRYLNHVRSKGMGRMGVAGRVAVVGGDGIERRTETRAHPIPPDAIRQPTDLPANRPERSTARTPPIPQANGGGVVGGGGGDIVVITVTVVVRRPRDRHRGLRATVGMGFRSRNRDVAR